MPALPVAVTGDLVDPKFGPPNAVASVTTSVLAMGKPVATLGAIIAPHGNWTNPKAPGYNKLCKAATAAFKTSTCVFVEGKPVAVVGPPGTGTMCSCKYHSIVGPGAPSIMVGI